MGILFERLFRKHILERGFSYYQRGNVTELRHSENTIEAVVKGTRAYLVRIELGKETIDHLDCTCPYFSDGHNCKHLAAVFYTVTGDKTGIYTDLELARKIVRGLPAEDLQEFVKQTLEIHRSVLNSFLRSFHADDNLSPGLQLGQIRSLFKFYSGRYNFIAQDDLDSFGDELSRLIEVAERATHEEKWDLAFTLLKELITDLWTVEVEDEWGLVAWSVSRLVDALTRLLDEGPEEQEAKIFTWLYAFLKKTGYNELSEGLYAILFEFFKQERYLLQKLDLVGKELAGWDTDALPPHRLYWLEHYVAILLDLGETKQAEALIRKGLHLPHFRLFVADQYLRRGEDEHALRLLEEGKRLFAGKNHILDEYSCKLIEIHSLRDDQHSLLAERRRRLLEYAPGNLQTYLAYRGMFDPREWLQERDYILYRLKEKGANVKPIYVEENLLPELLQALQENCTRWDLDEYEELLKDAYPEEFRDLLVQQAKTMAEHAGGRHHYIRLRNLLWQIGPYPGGEEIVARLREEWKTKYKRRWAMMEELDLDL